MGNYLTQKLLLLKEKFPIIKDVRGRGLIIGVELGIEGKEIVNQAMKYGLILNCIGTNVLRFVPPLIINEGHVDEAIAIFERVLSERV